VFTQFRRKTELDATVRAVLRNQLKSYLRNSRTSLPTLADLNIEFVAIDSRAAIQFKEKQADESTEPLFFETKTFCLETRNGMVGEDSLNSLLGWLWVVFLQRIYNQIKKL
jgi:hypothetical protein